MKENSLPFKTAKEMVEDMSTEETMFADGFEDAIIGVVERVDFGETIALYDTDKVIEIIKERDGLSHEQSVEFFRYNVLGSYVGDGTPAFATLYV